MVVYLRQVEKADLFRNLHNLKGKEKWKNVFFNDDYTDAQTIDQRDLRALAKSLRQENRKGGENKSWDAMVRGKKV